MALRPTLSRLGDVRVSRVRAAIKGSLVAIHRVERGVSPRIVKAAVIGTGGTTFIHGSALRAKLGLNSAWATFRGMSVSPAPASKMTIARGASVTLEGRLYPAITDGAAVTLYENSDGRWKTRQVTTSRIVQSLPDGYTAAYSRYRITVSPTATTQYYFKSATTTSPTTTVAVGG